MATVFCQSEACKWYKNGECGREEISLDYDNECENFESYLDDEEWQKPYWKRCFDTETKQAYRVLSHGKEIEIKGLKFFVVVDGDYAVATEKTTGVSCGHRCQLESSIEKIIEKIQKYDIPSLETLPIGEYDEKTGRIMPLPEAPKGGGE